MQPAHYFSDSLQLYCMNNLDGTIQDWLVALSTDDLLKLMSQIEAIVSPTPIGISSLEGFDLHYLAYTAESQNRKKRIINLTWEKRKKILKEISMIIFTEIEKRVARLKSLMADALRSFGNEEKAEKWMAQYHVAFGGTPISMLNTEFGANEVRKILASISYGGVV